jgi:hypothetical protein
MSEQIKISASQYRRILKKKKSWSRCGRDGIPYGVYKNLPCLDDTIVWLLNCISEPGNHYPKGWQEAEACFIYKKGEGHLEKSYRTITLTQSISKIYSSILLQMMMDHMIRNKYLATSQKGFIEGKYFRLSRASLPIGGNNERIKRELQSFLLYDGHPISL